MNTEQKLFLKMAAAAAKQADHIFPQMAACEAALECAYGHSALAVRDNNLFGCKQHKHEIYGTHILPTREFQDGTWIEVSARWIHYPGWAACFFDRMATLHRLASVYPHYKAALDAAGPHTYIVEVSQTWSTDPQRADKVQAIYDEMGTEWDAPAAPPASTSSNVT